MDKELLFKAATFCSSAEHCIAEVRDKLLKWGAEESDVEPIIDYLVAEKYIDESRYCLAFVNDKLRFAKWGRIKISYMLRLKHIDSAIINNALGQIDDEEYMHVLQDLLTSKKKTLRTTKPEELNLKLYRFAAGRGFDSREISQALRLINE